MPNEYKSFKNFPPESMALAHICVIKSDGGWKNDKMELRHGMLCACKAYKPVYMSEDIRQALVRLEERTKNIMQSR